MIAPEWYWKGRPEYEASDDEKKYKFLGVLKSVMQKDMLGLGVRSHGVSPTEVELREGHNLTAQRGGSNDRRKGPQRASSLFTNKGGDKRCAFCLGGHPQKIAKRCKT